jgi:hypothetical protein
MRIMTSDAGEPDTAFSPSSALLQTVGCSLTWMAPIFESPCKIASEDVRGHAQQKSTESTGLSFAGFIMFPLASTIPELISATCSGPDP